MENLNQTADERIEVFERYFEQAAIAGCPKDQIDGFANRGYIAQPRQ